MKSVKQLEKMYKSGEPLSYTEQLLYDRHVFEKTGQHLDRFKGKGKKPKDNSIPIPTYGNKADGQRLNKIDPMLRNAIRPSQSVS